MTDRVRVRRASLSVAERLIVDDEMAGFVAELSDEQRRALPRRWSFWRRPAQTPPEGAWRVWMVRAGRGFGKTRTGAETVKERVLRGLAGRVALIAPTASDARDVMVEGESGLIAVHGPSDSPRYEPSKRRVTWPNGAIATLYSAEEPERLRGPQHDWAWGDEPASWRYGPLTFDNALLGLRLGSDPRLILTGTPKPVQWLRQAMDRTDAITTTGSTYDNAAFLADTFLTDVLGRYEGTRLGRQELHAEWLDDIEGALWTERSIDDHRLDKFDVNDPWPSLDAALAVRGLPIADRDRRPWRTIVAVDPPGETAECGIAVAAAPVRGIAGRDHAVILDDASLAGRPEQWGAAVVGAAKRWNAERIVVESNQGGDMVRSTIHAVDPNVRVEKITAKESKSARAEPVSALYERGWVHHVGFLPLLESQMVTWVPSDAKSPDRLDALVHAVRFLLAPVRVAHASVESPVGRRIPT